jgi:prepilin-type N-terminal cleavage/methylation domain-containing protein
VGGGHCTAFTLVEMLLVLTIISVLAGSVVVAFEGRSDAFRLAFAASDLAATLDDVADRARLANSAYRVRLVANTAFVVEKRSASSGATYVPAEGGDRLHPLPTGVWVAEITGATGVPLEGDALEFVPGGASFAGRVRLVNRRGETRSVVVLPVTGQTSIDASDGQ